MSTVQFGVSTVVIAILISIAFAEPPIPGIYGNAKVATSDNTKGVRYAGPIVYTNEKPPIISFPSPPKSGFGGGKGGKGTSVKYIPLPHHDLPVLIYQSDIAPPLHVVGVAPGPIGDKESYASSYKDSYSAGSEQFVANYGAPPSTSYGAPPKDSYGAPPKDSYGAPPKDSYGAPPKELYGPPIDSYPKEYYGPAKDSYGPPKGSSSYGPPESSSSYGPPKSSSSYGPPKSSSSYGSPKSSSSYGPPKSSSSYGSPKSSSSYGPPKSSSSYDPPKSSSSYGPPKGSSYRPSSKSSYRPPSKSTYGTPKSKSSSGRYKSHSSTKSSYGSPKSTHVKGDYGSASSGVTYTAEFVPHKSKSSKGKGNGSETDAEIPLQQSPIYMSAPKAQTRYEAPPKSNDDRWIASSSSSKSNDGWIPKSQSTKSKSVYQEGAGTLEDSWSHGSETYVTTVPFSHGSTSTGKKEQKGRDQSHYGKSSTSSEDKGHRHTSSGSNTSGSGDKKSKSQSHHSGSGKDGRRKSQHHSSHSYSKKPTSSQGGIFSDIGEMWKSVMDSAIAGSSHIASAYGYNSRPSKQTKGHSHSYAPSSSPHKSKSTKYYLAPVQKPPIIIYQGPAPPVHVYEKPGSSVFGSFDRRNDDVDPRSGGQITQLHETPVPMWIPNMQIPSNYQTVYVSDLTSGGVGQGTSQYTPTSPVQTYAVPQNQMTSASEQVGISVQAPQTVLVTGQQQSESIQTEQNGIPASTVSMMFNLS